MAMSGSSMEESMLGLLSVSSNENHCKSQCRGQYQGLSRRSLKCSYQAIYLINGRVKVRVNIRVKVRVNVRINVRINVKVNVRIRQNKCQGRCNVIIQKFLGSLSANEEMWLQYVLFTFPNIFNICSVFCNKKTSFLL
jgi:hypothetical protein